MNVVPFRMLRLTEREKQEKLALLAQREGFETIDQMFQDAIGDSLAPCICIECNATARLEKDQDRGVCHLCTRNKMVSCLILGGIV